MTLDALDRLTDQDRATVESEMRRRSLRLTPEGYADFLFATWRGMKYEAACERVEHYLAEKKRLADEEAQRNVRKRPPRKRPNNRDSNNNDSNNRSSNNKNLTGRGSNSRNSNNSRALPKSESPAQPARRRGIAPLRAQKASESLGTATTLGSRGSA